MYTYQKIKRCLIFQSQNKMIPKIDFNNLTDEEITELRKQIPRKKKYQRKGTYRRKENPTRFFTPDEWELFIYKTNDKWRFYFWFLLLTGVRYKEAKKIKINDFDFPNRQLLIKHPKGENIGKVMRYVQLSNYAKKYIEARKKIMNLSSESTFNFPTIQGLIDYMRKILKQVNIPDWRDFSIHNIRKTHENYLVSLSVPDQKLTRHMGHTQQTANEHYISGSYIKDKKQLDKLRTWLGDAFI